MLFLRRSLLGFLAALFVGVVTGYGQPAPAARVFQLGEDLVYNVRYGPFDLGSVRVLVLERQATPQHIVYYCKALINSYPKVPFVDLHATYESYIDTMMYSHKFIGRLKQDDWWSFSRYTFEYDKKRAILEKGDRDTIVSKRDTMALEGVVEDGLSLFFAAREHLLSGKNMTLPTMINEERVTTRINFTGKEEPAEVDAIAYPVDAVKFEGNADFVGIFGLTGGFEGWFSNDEARVPIMAKMKVILGSVTIELMQWKRAGWTPPRAKE
ncbi:MAG: DUF3108 domain-containing protein [Bacteroidota bacterium]